MDVAMRDMIHAHVPPNKRNSCIVIYIHINSNKGVVFFIFMKLFC